jgi:hypothetical protein
MIRNQDPAGFMQKKMGHDLTIDNMKLNGLEI